MSREKRFVLVTSEPRQGKRSVWHAVSGTIEKCPDLLLDAVVVLIKRERSQLGAGLSLRRGVIHRPPMETSVTTRIDGTYRYKDGWNAAALHTPVGDVSLPELDVMGEMKIGVLHDEWWLHAIDIATLSEIDDVLDRKGEP